MAGRLRLEANGLEVDAVHMYCLCIALDGSRSSENYTQAHRTPYKHRRCLQHICRMSARIGNKEEPMGPRKCDQRDSRMYPFATAISAIPDS